MTNPEHIHWNREKYTEIDFRFLSEIKWITTNAKDMQQILSNENWEVELKNESSFKAVYLYKLLRIMVLFPCEDLNQKLYKAGFNDKLTQWFVPIEKLKLEIEKLKIENIVLEGLILYTIQHYLRRKMVVAFYHQLTRIAKGALQFYDEAKAVEIVYRRRKNTPANKEVKTDNSVEAFVSLLLEDSEQFFKSMNVNDYRLRAKRLVKGIYIERSREEMLSLIFLGVHPIVKKSQSDWLFSLKNLFSLFVKDINWTLKGFKDVDGLYEKNYTKYVCQNIKNLTGFKAKDDFSQFLIRLQGNP